MLTAARHLQLAGRDAEAVALMTGKRGGGVPTVDAMRLSLAADCYTHALQHARRQGLSRRTLADLLGSLVMVASVFDWSLSEHVRDEMHRLSREVGLDRLEALRGGLSAKTTLELCMEHAAQAHAAADDERLTPPQALSRLGRFGSALSLSLSGAHDVAGLRELVELLRQVRGDSELTAVRYEAAQQLLEIIEGREVSRLPLEILGRYRTVPGLNAAARAAAIGVHAHAVGVWLAERGDANGVQIADGFEQAVPGIWIAAHVHWLTAGFACDGRAMAGWETRAMAVAPDDLWRRRGFLRAEARLHALTGDLLSLGAVLPEMDVLAEHFEGWRPLRDWAWGEHHLIRGDLDEAEAHLRRAAQATGAGEHVAYGYAHPAWVAAQVLRGDARGAAAAAEEGLAQARRLRLSPVAGLDWLLSLAEARTQLGELDQAEATLQRAARLLEKARLGGIHAGRVAEAMARCALRQGDPQAARGHLRALEPSFRDGAIPQLMSRYVRLQHEVQRGEGASDSGGDLRWTPVSETRELRDRVQEVLTGEGDPVTRTREALTLLGDTDEVPTRRR
jgi:tetratricopeptide (TPR) repeat protein